MFVAVGFYCISYAAMCIAGRIPRMCDVASGRSYRTKSALIAACSWESVFEEASSEGSIFTAMSGAIPTPSIS